MNDSDLDKKVKALTTNSRVKGRQRYNSKTGNIQLKLFS